MTIRHGVPANIFTAILMQESGYQLEAKGCHTGILYELNGIIDEQKDGMALIRFEGKVCSDFGISQIYFKTAKSFKFDINLLLFDLRYSVESGAIVLADFKKRYSHREINWWTRYNSSSKTKRSIYKKLVERYL